MSTEMNAICNLCKKRKANKPNSHIISNFLVVPTYGDRDNAESFLIESNQIPLSIINEEGTDNLEEREQQNNKGKENMEDNILCSICEKRLADFLESNFSQEFHFNSPNINSINTNEYKFDYFNFQNANVVLFHLTMYSLFWRVHISKTEIFKNFSLS